MYDTYSSSEFESKYTYHGTDLGATWRPEAVFFRLWAPAADSVAVYIYKSGDPNAHDLLLRIPMTADINGTWCAKLSGDHNGRYYCFAVTRNGETKLCCDPYAYTTGVNGHRAMILDTSSTDPEGWDNDSCIHRSVPITDAVIYEVHIRDITIHPESGVSRKGKYLGLTERNTSLPSGTPTALDHILDLGITHVQLQPVYDYGSVDEAQEDVPQYNWGYDPVNYNVPEGSYSTDPFHGEVRVRELKELIRCLHKNGIGVFMDVVYNHVYDAQRFCFNNVVPGYFSRPGSNGSGCGNDTASERSMVRKYIVDSLYHWVKEYHMDGFRFDLAGLIDAATIREAMDTIHATHPHVKFYGEGWCMDSILTKPDIPMTDQKNSELLPEFAFFNDTFRDLLRGSVFDAKEKGYLTGKTGSKSLLRSCFMGVTPWACSPRQSINYISCHDNHTLFDRLSLGLPRAPEEDIRRRCRLGAAFTLLSQGVPFLLAGEEMFRTKPLGKGSFDENSYCSPDAVNSIKWTDLDDPAHHASHHYYRGLIAFRKAHDCLRQTEREHVLSSVKPVPCPDPHTMIFMIRGEDERLVTVFNAGTKASRFTLPDGTWQLFIDGDQAGIEAIKEVAGAVSVPPLSAMVFVQRSPQHVTDVVAAMIWKEDSFLICQRNAHKARGLLWEFPGGKVASGESDQQALIRECAEELGIQVSVDDIVAQTLFHYPDIDIDLRLYRCTAFPGEIIPNEHDDIRWVHLQDVGGYDFSPADKVLLKQILSR